MSEQTSIPADPELDPTASYATDQSVIRRLAGLLRATAGTRTSYAPATGQPVAELPLSSPDDVVAAVRSARRTQRSWKNTYLADRAAILLRYHDLVLDHRHELVDLVIVALAIAGVVQIRNTHGANGAGRGGYFLETDLEFRKLIYRYLLVPPSKSIIFPSEHDEQSFRVDNPELQIDILLANRQVYREARAILYGENKFVGEHASDWFFPIGVQANPARGLKLFRSRR